MKKVIVEFEERAKKVYVELTQNNNKQSKIIYKAINKKIDLIQENAHYGEPIAKRKIPYNNAMNLFWVKLPFGWRMLYVLKGNEVEIIAFVIDILDHKNYEKKFQY